MHATHLRYLLVAAAALIVGLLVAGTPVRALPPFVLLLACPLMMVFMMRGMNGHTGHGADKDTSGGHDHPVHDRDDAPTSR